MAELGPSQGSYQVTESTLPEGDRMLRSLVLSLTLTAVLSAGTAAAEMLPFEGNWAQRIDLCVTIDAPITLTARRLASSVMTCEFTSVLPGGMSYRIEAACEALGLRGDEFFTFAVLNGRLYWTWAGETGIFERCPQ